MKGTATGAAADSNRSNVAGGMGSSGRSTISRDVNRQMATASLQSRNRNSHGSRKRVSLASNPTSSGQKRVTFNQVTSQLTVDESNANVINNQNVPLQALDEEANIRQMHTVGEHEVNEGGADESPSSLQKPKKKQQIKTVKINSKISQQRDAMQTTASRSKQPAVLNSRSIQLESSQQKSSEKSKEHYDLGASYFDNEEPIGYTTIDDGYEHIDEAAILAQRQQRRKIRYQQRIDALKQQEDEQAPQDITQSAPISEQHKNITIHSPRDSDFDQAMIDMPNIEVQQVSDEPTGSMSKAEVPPALSAPDLSEETSSPVAAGMHLNLARDVSVDKNNSIISEVDPAFEEQTPNHKAHSKDYLPTGKGPSQAELATFQQRSLSNADQTIPPDCDTPKGVRDVKKDEDKAHGRGGKAASKLLIGSKKAASGNYEHLVVESAKVKQKTPIHNAPSSSAQKSQTAAWNFNLKSKIKRMQTVGRQPQRSSNRNGIISKSPLKNSPSINSKGMFTAFDIESVISRQKQTTGRKGRFEDAGRNRRDERNGSSLNLTVDNQLDQLSLNIGQVKGQIRNVTRDQLLSSEGRDFECDGATVKDAVTPGQGTFSMLSSTKGKATSPFTRTNRMRKKSNEPYQQIIASSSFRRNKMIISSGPVAKRSSTMRNKGGDEKGSKILDQRSQLSDQDMMKRSGGVGSAHSKYDVLFEDEEDSGFAAVDTDDLVRQRIENSNRKMMAVYTRNPYKVQSIDTIRLLEKQHSGLQPQHQLSQSRRRPDKQTSQLYRAENHLALRNKRKSRVSALHRGSIGSGTRAVDVSIAHDGSLTGRNNRSEILNDDSTDKAEYLVHLLQRLQESDANQGAVEKEFRLCLYQQVERELEKRERLLSQQVNWLRKQKQLCEVYGQSLSHVVQAMTQVPEQQKHSKDSADGKRPKRLKNLNAELLQPVNTRRRKEEQIVAMHDPTMAASILAESVPEPREIVDTSQADGFALKSSMVNKRHSEQIRDQRDQVSPNHLLTSSLNSNSMFHQPDTNQKEGGKGANHLLHQLVSICQRLRYSPDKVSYLRSLLRSVERYDHEMKKLLRHTYRKKSPGQDGYRKSVDGTPHPLLSNFIESGIDEGKPSESEIRFYKLSLIQLNRLIQANKIHSTLVKMDMSRHAPAGTTSTQFHSFHSKAGGGSVYMQSPLGEAELTSRNDGLHTSVPPRHGGGEQLIDYFDRKLMERKSLETATKFGTNVPNSTREQFHGTGLVKRPVDEDTMEEMSKETKNFFADDSVGEVRISHSHKKTIQKYRKKRKDMQATASVSKDGGIDFIKENKKNLLPFFTQQMTSSDQNQSVSPPTHKEKQHMQQGKTNNKKPGLQSQKMGPFTQSNSPSLDKHQHNQKTNDSNGFIASGSLSVTQRNSQVSTTKPKVHDIATSSVSNSEHFQRERLSQTRVVPLPEPIKVKDNRTNANFEITRQYAPNLNTATSQQRVIVGHAAVNEQSPIRQRKANVMNEVRSSRHKLIQSGHQIIIDQSNRKNMLNFQLKHVSQKVPTSFLESQYDARLGNFNLRDKQSDYVSSSIIEASQQYNKFQSSAQSKALANVLEQQRELNRGMRNQQQGITQQLGGGSRIPGHRRNNLSMTGCTVASGSGKMGVKGSYSRDLSSVDDLGGQEILAQSVTYNKLITSSKKGSDHLPVTGSSTAMPNTMAYNGSSIAASSQNDSRMLPDRIRDAEPQQ